MGGSPHTVLVVLYDGVRLLDVAGPLEVFTMAVEHGAAYRTVLASPGGHDVRATGGVRLGADIALEKVETSPDTLIVPGSPDVGATVDDRPLLDQIVRLSGGADRIASVCAGAFALAAAGLLDGRRAATHWDLAGELARSYPAVMVDDDAIFVREGRVITSAGISSGIDLALALVEEDHGPGLARTVARHLVVFLQRPGGQSQFSVRLRIAGQRSEPLRAVLDEVAADPAGDHPVSAMAARSGLSVRHLTRLFRTETGLSPARYVELMRVEAARILVESGDERLDIVARRTGFGSPETLRRAFVREYGMPPAGYRARFRTTGITEGR